MVQPRIGVTTTYQGLATPSARTASRCRVAVEGSSSAFRDTIARLLHRRLRIVVLLALMPLGYFLLRAVSNPDPASVTGPAGLLLHAAVVALAVAVALLVWGTRRMCLHRLRALELVLFGSTALLFGWMQYAGFAFDRPFGLTCPMTEQDMKQDLLRVAATSTAMRWFFLIVIYGVFIPNTWRRCAWVTGVTALLPLVLTPVGAVIHGHWGPGLRAAMPDMAVLMLTSFAVAVFGSYRFQMLEAQAFRAQQLGQYRLKQRLGAGGMGEVYLAEHLLLRRPCAVKLIRPDQAIEPTTLQRFEREVQAMATLTHPNTVEVYDYGHTEDATFYYVMEYLPGSTLETLVARHGPLPPGRAIHFLRQVCGALREAHGVGLLHRDVKPSNILACERGGVFDVAKLLDFGLVQESALAQKAAGRLTVQGTVLGSPPYMSPEQAAGKANLDGRSDLYGLGGVAYFLVTGQQPFVRETAMQMLLAHAYEKVVPPGQMRPDLPADLEAVILRCLEKEPGKRFADARELDRALAACRDAGAWTDEDAAAWWDAHGLPVPGADHSADMPTVLAAQQT
jgi:serine/threonine-protein kinase